MADRGTTIVCFSMSEWGDVPHNSRHLMHIAHRRGYRVIYVESIGLRRPRVSKRDLNKIGRRLRRMARPLRRIENGFWVVTPVALPLHGSNNVERWNRSLMRWQLKLVLTLLGVRECILWSYLPQMIPLRNGLRTRRVLYYRTDDYTAFPNVPAESIRLAERVAVAEADLCVAAAERYLHGVLKEARASIWVPNAVDIDHYAMVRPNDRIVRDRPRVMMVGTLDSWMATEMLAEVAQMEPGWQFVFAGPLRTDMQSLLQNNNVTYLGVVAYEKLPALIATADIGIIPFRLGPVSAGATPGKMYQYLAAGKPVVATTFLDPGEFAGHVYLADEEAGPFAAAIRRALREDDEARQTERRALAARHTWDARFTQIERALELDGTPRG